MTDEEQDALDAAIVELVKDWRTLVQNGKEEQRELTTVLTDVKDALDGLARARTSAPPVPVFQTTRALGGRQRAFQALPGVCRHPVVVVARICTGAESVNSGDIKLASGCEFDRFLESGGLVTWNHKGDPVARCTGIWRDSEADPNLYARIVFFDRTDEQRSIAARFALGELAHFSVEAHRINVPVPPLELPPEPGAVTFTVYDRDMNRVDQVDHGETEQIRRKWKQVCRQATLAHKRNAHQLNNGKVWYRWRLTGLSAVDQGAVPGCGVISIKSEPQEDSDHVTR